MEHLTCLTPEELAYFIKVAELKVVAAVPEQIVLQGESIFTYVFDNTKQLYCFVKGTKS